MCYNVVGKKDFVTKYNQAAGLLIPGGREYFFLSQVSVVFSKNSQIQGARVQEQGTVGPFS